MSTKKALLIGINYVGSSNPLYGCVNDVLNMKNILETKFKFSVTVLTAPMRANIQSEITRFISGIKAGDTYVFHYSGHGSSVLDRTGDETDGRDEVLVPLDYLTAGVITDDWLMSNLCAKVVSGATLWCFTDCCHSGSILDLKYNVQSECTKRVGTTGTTGYKAIEWNDKFSFTVEKSQEILGRVYCLSGCQDAQTSADANINGQAQGAFTYCLIQTLTGTESKTVRDALKQINALLDIRGYKQDSQLSISHINSLNDPLSL